MSEARQLIGDDVIILIEEPSKIEGNLFSLKEVGSYVVPIVPNVGEHVTLEEGQLSKTYEVYKVEYVLKLKKVIGDNFCTKVYLRG